VILKQALKLAAQRLAVNSDIENPRLESEILLRYVLKIDRAQLFLDTDKELKVAAEDLFWQWIARRVHGEPAAYIIKSREFYGLDFIVDQRVLIPRPETELLVEEALRFLRSHPDSTTADIGTGSGAIAISLAVNLFQPHPVVDCSSLVNSQEYRSPRDCHPQQNGIKIYATDISAFALEVALLNAKKHHVTKLISFHQGDLLEPLPEPVDILLANLPYVKNTDLKNMPSSGYEPTLALDGGGDGLNQIRRLCRQIESKVKSGGLALLEIGMGQGPDVHNILHAALKDSKIKVLPDLASIDRVVAINIP
jgi:release factor glutamine methyltransferase